MNLEPIGRHQPPEVVQGALDTQDQRLLAANRAIGVVERLRGQREALVAGNLTVLVADPFEIFQQ